jgi:hypothetical protein
MRFGKVVLCLLIHQHIKLRPGKYVRAIIIRLATIGRLSNNQEDLFLST